MLWLRQAFLYSIMILRKPSLLLCSYSKCPSLPSLRYHTISPNPFEVSFAQEEHPLRPRHSRPLREYATVRDDPDPPDDIPWPKSKSNAIPTPYQIFQQKKNAPYSKRRFYKLVKIYHPDRHSCNHSSPDGRPLARAVMIERYRLVVAANDILSHPAKRKSYDQCGAGWDGLPEHRFRRDQRSYDADGRWTGFEDNNSSPFRNATWEDWEQWYQRNDKGQRKPQHQVFLSNGGFLSLVAIIACLGGIGQATRIGDRKISYIKQLESTNAECTENVRRRMEQAQGFENKDTRVTSFLRAREESRIAATAMEGDNDGLLLPPPDAS